MGSQHLLEVSFTTGIALLVSKLLRRKEENGRKEEKSLIVTYLDTFKIIFTDIYGGESDIVIRFGIVRLAFQIGKWIWVSEFRMKSRARLRWKKTCTCMRGQ